MNHVSLISDSPHLFSAQRIGIITSAIIHTAIVLLLLHMPVTRMIPHLQTIQISLEQQGALSPAPQGTKQIRTAKGYQTQNKINRNTFLKPSPVQKEASRETTVDGKRETIKPFLPAEKPVAAENRNAEVAGSISTTSQDATF